MKRFLLVLLAALPLAGCYAYGPPPPRYVYARPGCVWIPARQTYYGWVPGHWRC